MKREFLEGLDLGEGVKLSKGAIDAIMAEHGKDIEAQKTTITSLTRERDGLQTQLDTAKGWEQKYNAEIPELTKARDALQKDIDTRNARDKVSAETGVPASLLTGDTEESCKAQADAIMKWHGTNQQQNYPSGAGVGGDPPAGSGGSTRDQFADWWTADAE